MWPSNVKKHTQNHTLIYLIHTHTHTHHHSHAQLIMLHTWYKTLLYMSELYRIDHYNQLSLFKQYIVTIYIPRLARVSPSCYFVLKVWDSNVDVKYSNV